MCLREHGTTRCIEIPLLSENKSLLLPPSLHAPSFSRQETSLCVFADFSLADLRLVPFITKRHLADLAASARHACTLAFSRPVRVKQLQSSSVPSKNVRVTVSRLLYAGCCVREPPSQKPDDEAHIHHPFWVKCLSHFTCLTSRRFKRRFLASA